ncbi:putative protein tag-278 [Maniola hyperantus]|uniref:putative protein tag-278 n=1 Tax=Aphantopus hyperantus TaxID=2795564 RepID=UPI001569C0DA|nr:uncharacterized protein LOC117986720 [Maniola hyperantus]
MSAYEDSVLDFDINFLHPSEITVNNSQSDKRRKQVLLCKKKIVGTDVLLKNHYICREKLEAKEVMFLTAKEECKQVCINYQDALEKYTQLEKELHTLKKQYAEIESKCTLYENQYEGMKSHANQLQILVKERESSIEALKVEKHLEKNDSVDYEKNLSAKEKEIEGLLKHLKSLDKDNALKLVPKKIRKRHKLLLRKYDNLKTIYSEEDSSDSGNDQSDCFDQPPHSPLFTAPEDSAVDKIKQDVFKTNQLTICVKKDLTRLNEDNDSDFSNEVVSEDTGRGSSLAFSDGEKCFSSPDYFSNDSPITKEVNQANEPPVFIDTGTSPIRSHEVRSPRIFDDEADVNSLEYFITDISLSNEIVTIKEKRKLIDIGTSPIKDLEKVNIATSPLLFDECVERNVSEPLSKSEATDYQTRDVNDKCQSDIDTRKTPCIQIIDDTVFGVKGKHTKIDSLASHLELEISGKPVEEKKCLERNNSINFGVENSNDNEIEMILNTMRLAHRPITPIPATPVEIHKNKSRKLLEIERDNSILKDENKIIRSQLVNLSKEIMDIKYLLKIDKSKEEVSHEDNICVNTEIFDDTSQETIFISANGDDSNNRNKESEINSFSLSNSLRIEVSQELEYDILKPAAPSCISKQNDISQIHESPATDNLTENIANVTKNDSREAITFEEDLISEDESDIIIINNNVDYAPQDVSIECRKSRKSKNKNVSKLEKFKQKIRPKSKISENAPIRKLRSKSKLIPIVKLQKITQLDATAILNNKSAYEHAAKVLAEIKSKEKVSANKKRITRKAKKMVSDKNDDDDIDCLEQQKYIPENKKTNPEKHIRRKSNEQQYDKHLESIEDVDVSPITTRSRSRKLSSNYCVSPTEIDTRETSISEEKRKRLKRGATDSPIVSTKRVLRSSSIRDTFVDLDSVKKAVSYDIAETDYNSAKGQNHEFSIRSNEKRITRNNVSNSPYKIQNRKLSQSENEGQNNKVRNVSNSPYKIQNRKLSQSENEGQNNKVRNVSNSPYKTQNRKLSQSENEDQNTSDNIKNVSNAPNKIQGVKISDVNNAKEECNKSLQVTDLDPISSQISHPRQSILCRMLEKHGRRDPKSSNKKVPDNIINSISKKLEDGIALINELPSGKVKPAMNKLVEEVQSWNVKHFMLGFMKYLKDPDRKRELYNKVNSPPAPPMTKSEQVLLYIVRQMEIQTPNTVNEILTHIEFSLFQLNRTPEFDIIESLSHFYALLCRYFGLKSRLRLFLLDAMYCVQFKVVPLIKQCLDVWMHILPLAHMGIAKSPLVTCLVYLLHFYKCEDRFNRVQEIRTILSRKYFYEITDWNEKTILEMFKNAIKDVRDIPIEKKMLRTALIILGKRHGAQWCHKNIIKNILMPMIEREDISMKIKQFCVQLLGALLKPFPADMKVHFEIAINHLHDMLQQDPPDAMKEAIFTSLIYINHHNPNRVIRSLLSWMPKQVSPEFEQLLRDYVRGKPLHAWKKILSNIKM